MDILENVIREKEYQLLIHFGDNILELPNCNIFNLGYSENLEKLRNAIKDSGISAADLRSKTLLILDSKYNLDNILLYSFMIGFSGRRLDVFNSNKVIEGASLNHFGLISKDNGKPNTNVEELILTDNEIEKIDQFQNKDIDFISKIRYNKKCYLLLENNIIDLTFFIKIASLRIRNNADHFPYLIKNSNDWAHIVEKVNNSNLKKESITEESSLENTGNDIDDDHLGNSNDNEDRISKINAEEAVIPIYNPEDYRKLGNELRREIKIDNRNTIVEKNNLSPRIEELSQLANLNIEEALKYLGSYPDSEGIYWRCPRPERHNNGDLNPSMKINEGKVRCYKCDNEEIDTLRLLMDTLLISTDDAAKILRSNYLVNYEI